MRLLHLADIHLDTLFARRSQRLRERLREASREAFRRAVGLAIREEVDAVLVAGDLFDGHRLSFPTERFLLEELRRLGEAGIPCLYCTGNHDPGSGIAGDGRIRWPAHVELFADGEPRSVVIERGGRPVGTVTSAGHRTDREGDDLSARFGGRPDPSLPAVAMLHTQVTGAGGAEAHERYAPSELPSLRRAPFDYWALGHIHLRQTLETTPGIRYPGNLQGRSPRETGAKGGLLVELPGPGATPAVEFVDLAPIRWEVLEVDGIDAIHTLDGLLHRIAELWREARGAEPGRPGTEWIVRVRLTGASPLAGELALEENRRTLVSETAQNLDLLEVELRTGGVRSTVDPAEYRERQDPVGLALRILRSLEGADPGADSDLPMEVDPSTLAGLVDAPGSDPADYIREILGDEVGARILIDRFRALGEGR
jgi:DNA repair protein SbcD/Mre11